MAWPRDHLTGASTRAPAEPQKPGWEAARTQQIWACRNMETTRLDLLQRPAWTMAASPEAQIQGWGCLCPPGGHNWSAPGTDTSTDAGVPSSVRGGGPSLTVKLTLPAITHTLSLGEDTLLGTSHTWR